MTIDSQLPERSDDPLSEARRWLLRLRSGEASQSDIDALARWRAESPAHRRAFADANAQWDVLRLAARNVAAKQERGVYGVAGASASSGMTRRVWLGGAMAASIGGAVYLAARPPLDLWPSLSELAADYRTGNCRPPRFTTPSRTRRRRSNRSLSSRWTGTTRR